MMKLLRGLLLALTIMAAPAVANAQTAGQPASQTEAAERLVLANKFLALMQGDQMAASMRQMMSMMTPANSNVPADERAMINEVTGEMVEIMLPRLFEAMAPVYADIFTLEELRALVAFYESDLGRSMVRKSFEASPRIAEAAMAVMPGVMSEMSDRLCDRLECTADQRRAVKAAMTQAYPAR